MIINANENWLNSKRLHLVMLVTALMEKVPQCVDVGSEDVQGYDLPLSTSPHVEAIANDIKEIRICSLRASETEVLCVIDFP